MKPIIYVAHPVTGDPIGNCERAERWVTWFIEQDPSRIYIAPWVAEVRGTAGKTISPGFLQRILDDDVEVVNRLDGLVGVGGQWSNGMLQERVVPRLNDQLLDMTMYVEPTDVPAGFDIAASWRAGHPRTAEGGTPWVN